MPLDTLANPLVLPVLGLLVESPAHPYALTARLNERYPSVPTQRSSVTTLVQSLAGAGLLRAQRAVRVGKRPRRKVYELTGEGVAEFRARVAAQIEGAPAASTRFTLALAYVGILTRGQALAVLGTRLRRCRGERDAVVPLPAGMPELQMIEADYWKGILAAECDWLESFIRRIETCDIAWPVEPSEED